MALLSTDLGDKYRGRKKQKRERASTTQIKQTTDVRHSHYDVVAATALNSFSILNFPPT
jgi:hypothetical protein